MTITINSIVVPSEDVVAREIEGELIIVPLVAGIGDMEDELYTLNDTGKAIWLLLDGKRDLSDVVSSLANEYESSTAEITEDVLGLVDELINWRMLVEVTKV